MLCQPTGPMTTSKGPYPLLPMALPLVECSVIGKSVHLRAGCVATRWHRSFRTAFGAMTSSGSVCAERHARSGCRTRCGRRDGDALQHDAALSARRLVRSVALAGGERT